ncbi:MAG: molybdopterin-binding protein [Sulfurovaceae bacterium]|nr:molybdopterin-binding protein [Sulfurovaceae bacterium]
MNFYALIIGTEILNRRRTDKHFEFLSTELAKYGYTLKGSVIIADEPNLIISTLNWLNSLPNSIVFSFGGIGSTPDDYTRQAASEALSDGKLYQHKEAKSIIESALGDKAYPHAIKMADLPLEAHIIENPFNKMPAFSMFDRFFFVPGFPEMSHPMIKDILVKLNITPRKIYRYTLTALCKESELIETMESLPKHIECSSLPKIYSDGPRVILSIASDDDTEAKNAFEMFTQMLDAKNISYALHDEDEN